MTVVDENFTYKKTKDRNFDESYDSAPCGFIA